MRVFAPKERGGLQSFEVAISSERAKAQ